MPAIAQQTTSTLPGQFYVEDTCIDCDLCRQTAARFFGRKMVGITGLTFVTRQPVTAQEQAQCLEALQACPVEAIRKN